MLSGTETLERGLGAPVTGVTDQRNVSMRVLMMPDFRPRNPYQQLLADALVNLGVEVNFPLGYRRGFPFLRAARSQPGARVFHLHWISPYLRGRSVLTQTAYCLRLLLDVALVRTSGIRVIWTIHNRVSHESSWPRLEKWMQSRLAGLVDRIVVHTRSSLEELRSDFTLPDDRTSVIPHGHFRSAYGPLVDPIHARRELGLPETGRIYLFLGMLRPYKGIEKLIRAWKETVSPDMRNTLLIAGDAIDEDFLARLKKLAGDCGSIDIRAGFIPPDRIPLYFSAADLVVLPFDKVLTSGSVVLAMSYGKPIIAPRLGSIAETVGNADDLLYESDDPDGLRLALERASGSALCAIQVKTDRMCESLDWKTIGEMTLDAYRRAAQTP